MEKDLSQKSLYISLCVCVFVCVFVFFDGKMIGVCGHFYGKYLRASRTFVPLNFWRIHVSPGKKNCAKHGI